MLSWPLAHIQKYSSNEWIMYSFIHGTLHTVIVHQIIVMVTLRTTEMQIVMPLHRTAAHRQALKGKHQVKFGIFPAGPWSGISHLSGWLRAMV